MHSFLYHVSCYLGALISFASISEIDGVLSLIQLGKSKHCFGGYCTFSDSQTEADFQLWFKGCLCY